MRPLLACALSGALMAVAMPAAALNVFACTPEWGALAGELAGDRARIYVATTALQDPHRVEARPSLIARARSADLVVCTGADLEAGWLPLVLTQSGNARIQSGQPGYFEAASSVETLEKPARADRAMGDVHPAGNPHLHLDPRNIAAVAAALAARLAALDPSQARDYREREKRFLARWGEAMTGWQALAAPLRGMPVVVHHRDLAYLVHWLGMREVGSLEPKPGLPPSGAHLQALLQALAATPAKAVVRSAYSDPRPARWLAERAGVPEIVLPYTVGGSAAATDLFALFDDTIARLLAAAK